ncbi:hypothetical protein [Streptomyces sp. 142MFCol3.1]|uniref:hypothetical protein n=1 Tax=Streptomyces sp. 142MFCol3.1 TaxID=1172179 RepID=UPI0004029534|nr:hypothetical protein [Streptomyces sp. 142MFCol3.1]
MSPTPGAGDNVAPPTDYRLLLPQGWFRVRIDPEGRERSVDALLERQFAGIDNAPHIRQQVRENLLAQAVAAFQDGGIELYISLQDAGSLTIPASLLVTLLPPPPGGTLPTVYELVGLLSADGDAEVSAVELPTGAAARVRRMTGQSDRPAPADLPGGTDQVLPSVTLDYQIPVPGAGAHLLLTFSTPLVQIADAMVELFEAVAGSLRWIDGDETHE